MAGRLPCSMETHGRIGGDPDARALEAWGWDARREEWVRRESFEHALARVVGQDRSRFSLQTARGPRPGRVTSRSGLAPPPAVGDWVAVEPGPTPTDPWTLLAVLPRRTLIARGAAGVEGQSQAVAANVDVVWIVHGLDLPVNPRRLERYLALAWDGGAVPEIVLTKADLATDPEASRDEAQAVALGTPVHLVRADDEGAVDRLRSRLAPGKTVTLLGPSGVGKSTLANLLARAPIAEIGQVREGDRKGRHTTVRRELFPLPGGALLLDTPGMRELRLGLVYDGLKETFADIERLAEACRFRDCHHVSEPGCAVLEAVEAGSLAPDRLASLRKLQAEVAHERRKADPVARAEALADWKTSMKTLKYHPKHRDQ